MPLDAKPHHQGNGHNTDDRGHADRRISAVHKETEEDSQDDEQQRDDRRRSLPLVNLTRATLRIAEFGFFGATTDWDQIAEFLFAGERKAEVRRTTKETDI